MATQVIADKHGYEYITFMILEHAKEHFIQMFDFRGGHGNMCDSIRWSLNQHVSVFDMDDIQHYIPLFNHSIAIEKFGASKDVYEWWDFRDKQSRINYFNWLISEYSKEI